jgi:hypothetical protein
MEIELFGEVVGEKSRFEVEVGQGGKSKNSFPTIFYSLCKCKYSLKTNEKSKSVDFKEKSSTVLSRLGKL